MYGGSGEITDPIRLGVVNDKLYELRSSSDFLLLFTLNNSRHCVSVGLYVGYVDCPCNAAKLTAVFEISVEIAKPKEPHRTSPKFCGGGTLRKYWCINNYPRIFMNRQPTMPRPHFGLPKPCLMAKLDIYKTKDVIIW